MFSTLPTLIIFHIVKSLLNENACYSSSNRLSANNIEILMRLGQVSKTWRSITQSQLYRCHSIQFTFTCKYIFWSAKAIQQNLSHTTHNHQVRQLNLTFNYRQIFTEEMLKLFDSQFPANVSFPSTRTVGIFFINLKSLPDETPNMIQIALQLGERIVKIAPKTSFVTLSLDECSDIESRDYWNAVNTLVAYLLKRKISARAIFRAPYCLPSNAEDTPRHLTGLSIYWKSEADDPIRLAHLNCSTLQKLTIYSGRSKDMSRLFIDSNSDYVAYKNLTDLDLFTKATDYSIAPNREVFANFIPFPVLERANIDIVYPFGDDVAFRGNTKTLKSITLRIDHNTQRMFITNKVFAGGRFTQLKQVKLHSHIQFFDDIQALSDDAAVFINDIASRAEYLLLVFGDASRLILSDFQKNKFTNIRYLDICEVHLSVRDVLRIVKALPLIQRLKSRLSGLPAFKSMAGSSKRVSEFCRKHSRINNNFQQWEIYYFGIGAVSFSSTYAAFLSVVCPRFTYLFLPCKYRESYYNELLGYQAGTFNEYSDSLQKLLSYRPTVNTDQ